MDAEKAVYNVLEFPMASVFTPADVLWLTAYAIVYESLLIRTGGTCDSLHAHRRTWRRYTAHIEVTNDETQTRISQFDADVVSSLPFCLCSGARI